MALQKCCGQVNGLSAVRVDVCITLICLESGIELSLLVVTVRRRAFMLAGASLPDAVAAAFVPRLAAAGALLDFLAFCGCLRASVAVVLLEA